MIKIKEPDIIDLKDKSQLAHIFSWYSNEKSKDDAKEYLIEFSEKYCPEYLSKIKKTNSSNIVVTYGWLARLIERGCDSFEKNTIEEYLKSLKEDKVQEDKIQKKIVKNEYDIDEFLGYMEEKIDDYILNKKPFNINDEIKRQSVPQKYLKDIREWINKKITDFQNEYEVMNVDVVGSIPYELKERVYSDNFSSKHIQRILAFLSLQEIKKERKKVVRHKKIDLNKQVSKVKYLQAYEDLQSINPVHIIGAKIAVTFNTKYKTLSIYKSNVASGLFVKGSSIYNFDESLGKKIIKKPEKDLRKFLMLNKEDMFGAYESLNTKPSKLNGQLNENTIILRVE